MDEMLSARYASYADQADVIRARFTDPRPTLRELFARIVFNILTSNTDDHARNHAAFWDGHTLTLTGGIKRTTLNDYRSMLRDPDDAVATAAAAWLEHRVTVELRPDQRAGDDGPRRRAHHDALPARPAGRRGRGQAHADLRRGLCRGARGGERRSTSMKFTTSVRTNLRCLPILIDGSTPLRAYGRARQQQKRGHLLGGHELRRRVGDGVDYRLVTARDVGGCLCHASY